MVLVLRDVVDVEIGSIGLIELLELWHIDRTSLLKALKNPLLFSRFRRLLEPLNFSSVELPLLFTSYLGMMEYVAFLLFRCKHGLCVSLDVLN